MHYLLPLTYHGNLYFFAHLFSGAQITIDQHEHFVKQTYRNRCTIYGANGKLDLIIPIRKNKKERTKTSTAIIDNSSDWQKLHYRSIESAYRRSSYFEYYEDKLLPFYEKKYDSLWEFNLALLEFYTNVFQKNISLNFTDTYLENPTEMIDLRQHFDPKNEAPFNHPGYFQCFETKHGFLPNLSILDLIFNCGPQGISYLGMK